MKLQQKTFYLGAALAFIPGVLWGLGGVFGQYLFHYYEINAEWLVTVRLIISGLLLLGWSMLRIGVQTFTIFHHKSDVTKLLIFSVFGVMAVQLTYFVAIDQSNAPTATILQYLFPVLIVLFSAVRSRKAPSRKEGIAVLLALLGTFLLVTHGNPSTLHITVSALLWGIGSAFAMAFYSLYPGALQKQYTSPVVVGWGMLLGGLILNIYHPFWAFEGHVDLLAVLMMIFIVVFSTFLAFYLFLVSVTMIGATHASLFACVEPLASAFFSVIGLHLQFNTIDWIGAGMILATMLLLSWKKT